MQSVAKVKNAQWCGQIFFQSVAMEMRRCLILQTTHVNGCRDAADFVSLLVRRNCDTIDEKQHWTSTETAAPPKAVSLSTP
jgi:hypothetical protein